MITGSDLLQLVLLIFFPLLAQRLSSWKSGWKWLSPVVQCYAIGILLRNSGFFPVNELLAETFRDLSILLAIPLLLFSTDLRRWWKEARKATLAFGLCVVSGVVASMLWALVFRYSLPDIWRIAGMLVGVYTGGTPNMNAIGLALGAPDAEILYLNGADIFCGGLFLLFLLSVAGKVYGWWLKGEKKGKGEKEEKREKADRADRTYWKPVSLAVGIVGLSMGGAWLLTGGLEALSLLLLLLTTASIGASLHGSVRQWGGSYPAGEYLLLIFCVALGFMADFSEIWGQSLAMLGYMAAVLISTATLHLLLARAFRIDRDTTLITATAALYGPVFVPQVASALGNRQIVFSGIAMGLLGYALGNYLGLGVAELTRWIIGS